MVARVRGRKKEGKQVQEGEYQPSHKMQSALCFMRCPWVDLMEPLLCVLCWGRKQTEKEQGYNSHFLPLPPSQRSNFTHGE